MNNKLRQVYFLLCAVLLLIISNKSLAQKSPGSEADIKKEASKFFEQEDFLDAYPLYSQLLSLHPDNGEYNYRFGTCMLFTKADKEKPVDYLEMATKQPDIEKLVYYYLGRAYHLNYRFDDAIKTYQKFQQSASSYDLKKHPVDHLIQMCNDGKTLLKDVHDLDVLVKKELSVTDYFHAYDLSANGGSTLLEPDDFKSKLDKKKLVNSVIYLSSDRNEVFFSSYGENGENGKDIYEVKRLPTGGFSKPVNLGTIINSPYDEDFPFYDVPTHTLYFCSQGHNSMGGFDIFKSVHNDALDVWSTPVNMDFPINTPDDDILFIADTLGQTAYFASTRSSPQGTIDIYKIKLQQHAPDNVLLKGITYTDNGKNPAAATITVKNYETGKTIGVYNSSHDDGSYFMNLPNGMQLVFSVETPGHITQTSPVLIPKQEELATLRQEIGYDSATDKLILTNHFEAKGVSDAEYLLALDYIKKKAMLDVNIDSTAPVTVNMPNNTQSSNQNNTGVASNNTSLTNNNSANNQNNGTVSVNSTNKQHNNTSTENNNSTTNNTSTQNNNSSTEHNSTASNNTSNNAANNSSTNTSENNTTSSSENSSTTTNNASNEQLVKIAGEDAQQQEQSAQTAKEDANKATEYANDKLQEAQNLNNEAQEIENNAANITNTKQKKDSLAKAASMRQEAKEATKKAVEAFQVAAQEQTDAQTKQRQADLTKKYSASLDSATKTKNNKEAIAKLQAQQDNLKQQQKSNPVTPVTAGDLIRQQAQNTRQDSTEVAHHNEQLKQEVDGLQTQSQDYIGQAQKTDNAQEKVALLQQAKDLADSKKHKQQEIQNNQKLEQQLHNQYVSQVSQAKSADSITKSSAQEGSPQISATDAASIKQEIEHYNPSATNNNNTVASNQNATQNSTGNNATNPLNSSENSTNQASANNATNRIANNTSSQNNSTTSTENTSNTTANNNTNTQSGNTTQNNSTTGIAQNNSTTGIANNNSGNSSSQNSTTNSSENSSNTAANNTNTQSGNTTQNNSTTAIANSSNSNSFAQNHTANSSENSSNTAANNNSSTQSNNTTQANNNIAGNNGANNSTTNSSQNTNVTNNSSTTGQQNSNNTLANNTNASNNSSAEQNGNQANNTTSTSNQNNNSSGTNNNTARNSQIVQYNNTSGVNNVISTNTVQYSSPEASQANQTATTYNNEATTLTSEANTARQQARQAATPDEARQLSEKADSLDKVAGQKKIQSVETTNTAGSDQFQSNKQQIAGYQNTLQNNNTDRVTTARLLSQEAEVYYNKSLIEKQKADSNSKPYLKEAFLDNQGKYLATALLKQQEAQNIYLSVNPFLSNSNTANTNLLASNQGNQLNNNTGTENSSNPNNSSNTQQNTANQNTANTSSNNSTSANNNTQLVQNNSQNNSSNPFNSSSNNTNQANALTANNSSAQQSNNAANSTENIANNNSTQSNTNSSAQNNSSSANQSANSTENLSSTNRVAQNNSNSNSASNNNAASNNAGNNSVQTNSQNSANNSNNSAQNANRIDSMLSASNNNASNQNSTTANNTQNNNNSSNSNQNAANNSNNSSSKTANNTNSTQNVASNNTQSGTNNSTENSTNTTNTNTVANNSNATNAANNTANNTQNNGSTTVANNSSANNNSSEAINNTSSQNNTAGNNSAGNNTASENNGNNSAANINQTASNQNNAANTATNNNTANNSNTANNTNNQATEGNSTTDNSNNTNRGTLTMSVTEDIFSETSASPYSTTKPIPVNQPLPEGLVFKVQIGAFRNSIPQNLFKGVQPITGEKTATGLTRYLAGIFKEYGGAKIAQTKIHELGFKDAFVVAFFNGKRISLAEAMNMQGGNAANQVVTNNTQNQNNTTTQEQPVITNTNGSSTTQVKDIKGLFYSVQVGAFKQPVTAAQLYNLAPLFSYNAPNGYIRYNCGIYSNIPMATVAKREIILKTPIKDAFIVAYSNGERIGIAQAAQLLSSGGAAITQDPKLNAMPNSTGSGTVINAPQTTTQESTPTPVVPPANNTAPVTPVNNNPVIPPANTSTAQTSVKDTTASSAATIQPANTNTVQTPAKDTTANSTATNQPANNNATQVTSQNNNTVQNTTAPINPPANNTLVIPTGTSIAARTFSTNTVAPAGDVTVSVTIRRGSISGFAKLEETVPNGFTASEGEKQNASFKFEDGKVKYVWLALPGDSIFTVTYKVTALSTASGQQSFSGRFLYTVNDERQESPVPASVLTVANTAANTSNDPAPANNTTSASNDTTNKKVVFCVQVGSYSGPIPIDMANKLLKISNQGIKAHREDNGTTSYTIGEYADYTSADLLKQELVKDGFTQAFNVAYYKGKKISLQQAQLLMNK